MKLGISSEVSFLPSVSSHEKEGLLATCTCVLYTPENEHFGIVPLEAMLASRPVLACDSGGPVESIIDGVTGFLCAPKPEVGERCGQAQLSSWSHFLYTNLTEISYTTGIRLCNETNQQRQHGSTTYGYPCQDARRKKV